MTLLHFTQTQNSVVVVVDIVTLAGYVPMLDLGLASVSPVGWLEPLKITSPALMY